MKKIAVIGSTGSIGRQALAVAAPLSRAVLRHGAGRPCEREALGRAGRRRAPRLCGAARGGGGRRHARGRPLCPRRGGVRGGVRLRGRGHRARRRVRVRGIEGDAARRRGGGRTSPSPTRRGLVVGGTLVLRRARERGVRILPVRPASIRRSGSACTLTRAAPFRRILLTASGGALRDLPLEALPSVTAAGGRSLTPTGRWGPRSPSTAPPCSTRASRSSRRCTCSAPPSRRSRCSSTARASSIRWSSSRTGRCSRRWGCLRWSCPSSSR